MADYSVTFFSQDNRPEQATNKIPLLEPDFQLDIGPSQTLCAFYSKNTICPETPEFCYGKLWPEKNRL